MKDSLYSPAIAQKHHLDPEFLTHVVNSSDKNNDAMMISSTPPPPVPSFKAKNTSTGISYCSSSYPCSSLLWNGNNENGSNKMMTDKKASTIHKVGGEEEEKINACSTAPSRHQAVPVPATYLKTFERGRQHQDQELVVLLHNDEKEYADCGIKSCNHDDDNTTMTTVVSSTTGRSSSNSSYISSTAPYYSTCSRYHQNQVQQECRQDEEDNKNTSSRHRQNCNQTESDDIRSLPSLFSDSSRGSISGTCCPIKSESGEEVATTTCVVTSSNTSHTTMEDDDELLLGVNLLSCSSSSGTEKRDKEDTTVTNTVHADKNILVGHENNMRNTHINQQITDDKKGAADVHGHIQHTTSSVDPPAAITTTSSNKSSAALLFGRLAKRTTKSYSLRQRASSKMRNTMSSKTATRNLIRDPSPLHERLAHHETYSSSLKRTHKSPQRRASSHVRPFYTYVNSQSAESTSRTRMLPSNSFDVAAPAVLSSPSRRQQSSGDADGFFLTRRKPSVDHFVPLNHSMSPIQKNGKMQISNTTTCQHLSRDPSPLHERLAHHATYSSSLKRTQKSPEKVSSHGCPFYTYVNPKSGENRTTMLSSNSFDAAAPALSSPSRRQQSAGDADVLFMDHVAPYNHSMSPIRKNATSNHVVRMRRSNSFTMAQEHWQQCRPPSLFKVRDPSPMRIPFRTLVTAGSFKGDDISEITDNAVVMRSLHGGTAVVANPLDPTSCDALSSTVPSTPAMSTTSSSTRGPTANPSPVLPSLDSPTSCNKHMEKNDTSKVKQQQEDDVLVYYDVEKIDQRRKDLESKRNDLYHRLAYQDTVSSARMKSKPQGEKILSSYDKKLIEEEKKAVNDASRRQRSGAAVGGAPRVLQEQQPAAPGQVFERLMIRGMEAALKNQMMVAKLVQEQKEWGALNSSR